MSALRRWAERAAALAAALVIPLSLRCLPLTRVLALCDRWPVVAARQATPEVLARRVRRWLAIGRGPWRSTCLTRSAVLYAMLRQHGYRAEFLVGVAGTAHCFGAHAWIAVGGQAIDQPEHVAQDYRLLLAHRA